MKKIVVIMAVAVIGVFVAYKIWWDDFAQDLQADVETFVESKDGLTIDAINVVGFPAFPVLELTNVVVTQHSQAGKEISIFPTVHVTGNLGFLRLEIDVASGNAIEYYDVAGKLVAKHVMESDEPYKLTLSSSKLKELYALYTQTKALEEPFSKELDALLVKAKDYDIAVAFSSTAANVTDTVSGDEAFSYDGLDLSFQYVGTAAPFNVKATLDGLEYKEGIYNLVQFFESRNIFLVDRKRSALSEQYKKNFYKDIGKISLKADVDGDFILGVAPSDRKFDITFNRFELSSDLASSSVTGYISARGAYPAPNFKNDINLVLSNTFTDKWYERILGGFGGELVDVYLAEIMKAYPEDQKNAVMEDYANMFKNHPELFIPRLQDYGTHKIVLNMNGQGNGVQRGIPKFTVSEVSYSNDAFGVSAKQVDPTKIFLEDPRVTISVESAPRLVGDIMGFVRELHPHIAKFGPKLAFTFPTDFEGNVLQALQILSDTPDQLTDSIDITVNNTTRQVGTLSSAELPARLQQIFGANMQDIVRQQRASVIEMRNNAIEQVPAQ